MCDKWKTEVLDAPNKTVYVNKWLARTTLDIIGEGLRLLLLGEQHVNETAQLRLPMTMVPSIREMTACRKYTAIFCKFTRGLVAKLCTYVVFVQHQDSAALIQVVASLAFYVELLPRCAHAIREVYPHERAPSYSPYDPCLPGSCRPGSR